MLELTFLNRELLARDVANSGFPQFPADYRVIDLNMGNNLIPQITSGMLSNESEAMITLKLVNCSIESIQARG